MFDENDLSSL